ncbi:fumarylacetoacetate hydrolase family protein [Roseococcus sp. YIM B11640]|uniref:fumarylacetoacetate hydrolase family protein n=1 Tax=Roseococcus sp. YIM B11640 TaxID=3133973 RepID=UPI003C7E4A87
MKLASLKEGRDGRLLLVSRDLSRSAPAAAARTLQAALDDWDSVLPALRAEWEALESGATAGAPFDPAACASPLPRAYQWADGSAYVNHVELVRRARGVEMPPSFWTDPLMYQGGSDGFLGPRDPIPLGDEAWGCDFEGEICVITGDVPYGATRGQAASSIRLLMLTNDVSLRNVIPGELAKGFGFFHGKPASAFSPVCVTPDEAGAGWDGAKLSGALHCTLNGIAFGKPDAGTDMTFDFPTLIAHAARTRALGAGTIVGSGTVSNKQGSLHGSTVANGGLGYACIAELRMYETIETGAPLTPFMRHGDTIRIEMLDAAGRSLFGAIDQKVAPP